jgi:hypothetical protein
MPFRVGCRETASIPRLARAADHVGDYPRRAAVPKATTLSWPGSSGVGDRERVGRHIRTLEALSML